MNNHVEPLFTQFPSVFSDEHSNEEQTGNRFLEMLGLRRSKACIQSANHLGSAPLPSDQSEPSLSSLVPHGALERSTEDSNTVNLQGGMLSASGLNKVDLCRFWMSNGSVCECCECRKKFTTFRRKHHCRLCGQIFCGSCCTSWIDGKNLGYSGMLRICRSCSEQIQKYNVPNRNVLEARIVRPCAVERPAPREEFGEICRHELKAEDGSSELSHNDCNTNFHEGIAESSSDFCANFDDLLQQISKNFPQDDSRFGSLTKKFFDVAEKIFDSMLLREQLETSIWKKLLWSASMKIIGQLYNKIISIKSSRSSRLDILDFVHIKKLVLDCTPSYEIFNGVAFTGSLAHTAMSCTRRNVSLMLLAGSVANERMVERMTAYESSLIQEKDYVGIQVQRILSSRAGCLLLEGSVANAAARMLLEKGISVVTNVKLDVLERISYKTNANILNSLDEQLLNPNTGFSPLFNQIKFQQLNGSKKTLIILDDLVKEPGISIILKAISLSDLIAAKRVLQFSLSTMLSALLEAHFLSIFDSKPSNFETISCEVCLFNRETDITQFTASDDKTSEFCHLLNHMSPSPSPAIQLALPYTEILAKRNTLPMQCTKNILSRCLCGNDFIQIRSAEDNWRNKLESLFELESKSAKENLKISHPFLSTGAVSIMPLLSSSKLANYRSSSSTFFRRRHAINKEVTNTRKKNVNNLIAERTRSEEASSSDGLQSDPLNPYIRQRISFLYCDAIRKTGRSTFCSGPYVLQRHFYHGKDTSLGAFLQNYCFTLEYKCRQCDRLMIEHVRQFVHRNSKVEVTTNLVPSGKNSTSALTDELALEELPSIIPNTSCDSIIYWRRCPLCAANSSAVKLPNSVFHLSFGKFIDYLSNGKHWISSLPTNNCSSNGVQQICTHCTFHQHQQYFSFANFVASFKVIPIRPLHVVFNSMICEIVPDRIECSQLIKEYFELNSMANDVFDRASLSLGIPMSNNHCSPRSEDLQHNPEPYHDSLVQFVLQYRSLFKDSINKFDVDGVFKGTTAVDSNTPDYLLAKCCFNCCRFYLRSFIEKWNDYRINLLKNTSNNDVNSRPRVGSTTLLHSISTNILHGFTGEMSSEENAETKKANNDDQINYELPYIENSNDLHFELPLNTMGVFVTGTVDTKKNQIYACPDVGSIAAYALASEDYQKLKGRENEDYLEVDFGDSKFQYSVKIYHFVEFQRLRSQIFSGDEEQFIHSLSRTIKWQPQGGKSGASFFRTQDERFVLKSLSRFEIDSFKKCGLNYMEYVRTALTDKKLTSLCKIFGVYTVNYVNKITNQNVKTDLIVMEYLFYGKDIVKTWDLKGSLRNRWASAKTEDVPVLLDENLVEDLLKNQLFVHPYCKNAINQAIINDSHFLCSQDIMDYSLLVGICQNNDEVVIGIVDYMRTFTLDKKVESLVKTALPISNTPTIISPEQYCKRFYEAIDGYFAIAVDQWTDFDFTN